MDTNRRFFTPGWDSNAHKLDTLDLLQKSVEFQHKWFPPLKGADVLCLASGGGQQGPILAATGANVTVFDNSPRQLEQDQRTQ
jgi:2-polyprenyl-3-methyl-5-hydroxy-6-metoxy-1,4-benzoquinol methylase